MCSGLPRLTSAGFTVALQSRPEPRIGLSPRVLTERYRAALSHVVVYRALATSPFLTCGVYIAASNKLRAFALSSAASSVRKPPEIERCTTQRASG